MEEFDLKKFNTGDYDVVTRDGRGVRILCTDANIQDEEYKIIALVDIKNTNRSTLLFYTIDGTYSKYGARTYSEDLILIKKKWTPKQGEKYWYIDVHGEIFRVEHFDSEFDNKMLNFGNCFHSKEEAAMMADKIRQVLNS